MPIVAPLRVACKPYRRRRGFNPEQARTLLRQRMGAADYLAALWAADAERAALPAKPHPPGPTPWDPTLREVFDRERRIVHQERLLSDLIA